MSVSGSSSNESQADILNLWPYDRLQEYVASTMYVKCALVLCCYDSIRNCLLLTWVDNFLLLLLFGLQLVDFHSVIYCVVLVVVFDAISSNNFFSKKRF